MRLPTDQNLGARPTPRPQGRQGRYDPTIELRVEQENAQREARAVEGVGDALNTYVEENERASAKENYIAFEKEKSALLYEQDDSFFNQRGYNAFSKSDETRKKLSDLKEKYLNNLGNSILAKDIFSAAADDALLRDQKSIGVYAAKERSTWLDAQDKAISELAWSNIKSSAGEPETVATAKDKYIAAQLNILKRAGQLTPEAKKLVLEDANSNAVIGVVQGLLDNGDFERAGKYLENNQDTLSVQDKASIQQLVATSFQVRDVAGDVFKAIGDSDLVAIYSDPSLNVVEKKRRLKTYASNPESTFSRSVYKKMIDSIDQTVEKSQEVDQLDQYRKISLALDGLVEDFNAGDPDDDLTLEKAQKFAADYEEIIELATNTLGKDSKYFKQFNTDIRAKSVSRAFYDATQKLKENVGDEGSWFSRRLSAIANTPQSLALAVGYPSLGINPMSPDQKRIDAPLIIEKELVYPTYESQVIFDYNRSIRDNDELYPTRQSKIDALSDLIKKYNASGRGITRGIKDSGKLKTRWNPQTGSFE